VVLHGELTAVEQADDKLKLTIARPPDAPQDSANQPSLPDDLAVDYVPLEPGAKGAPGRKPPRLNLAQGLQQPRRLPGGDFLLVTDHCAVKFGRGLVRVFRGR
jgi:hypothetical protein